MRAIFYIKWKYPQLGLALVAGLSGAEARGFSTVPSAGHRSLFAKSVLAILAIAPSPTLS